VRHELTANPATSTSYCELCGTGYITIVISNPFDRDTDLINMRVREDLGASGLTYAGNIQAWVNSTPVGGVSGPAISGADNEILTWQDTEISALASLSSTNNPATVNTITIRFSVQRAAPFTQEGLISASRDISVRLDYTAEDVGGTPGICPGTPTWILEEDTLPLREPNPTVAKVGRNVDAGQDAGEYTQQVYGNIDDDIIWRIEVGNAGTADLQDLELNDVLDVGSYGINDLLYICDSEAAATNAAVTGSAGACAAFPGGNSLTAYDVDLPFASPTAVDVPAGGTSYLYLVGKIPSSPNGSCSSARTNTVSDIHWGCDAEPPSGDIAATSFGASPGSATATLYTDSNTDLNIAVDYDGIGAANPDAGTKGRVVITITNFSGGTVSDLVVTNTLPPEYVVDATFTPTIAAAGAYGYYDGLTNLVNWDNPNGDPLLNTAPQFSLTSTASTNDGHANLLRHGDQLVLTFGIVLVRSASYDRQADLDIIQEVPADGTDPDHSVLANLPNSVSVTFNDFCSGGPNTDTFDSTHTARPEDLDIQTYGPSGPVLDYILTNSTSTTLTVRLTNNGGHSAADYYAYVAFGETMEVDTGSLPAGCTAAPTDMPPLTEWQTPLGFPASATIIECKESAGLPDIARNGGTVDLDFVVNKTTDPARIAADDLTFRADMIGEITLDDGTRLTFPTIVARGDGITDRANNYSMDGIRARVMGFNLNKTQSGNCSENNPPPGSPDDQVQIGEECTYNVQAGGWFGFLTPGYTPIQVRNVQVDDILPDGQGYVDRSAYTVSAQIANIDFQRSVAPTPPAQYDMAEGTLYWTFNDAGSYITTIEQWFELDVTTRLLNDPIDTSGAPNQHTANSTNTLTSTFDVVFLAGDPSEFTVPYGPGMSVYPPLAVRQVSLTVTEPSITVVKEVCNETLYGTGPSCTNWVAAANDGDALNTYIYRLTVTNEASNGGVTRAPAYDVTVTDTLDASDLALVEPFGADGLNNDGDAATDGADAGGEGAISDNTVKNASPAVITFSYTHSDALLRIDPGASVQLYYRVDFDDDAAPQQTFTNTAFATYDSLEGAYGSQSDPAPSPRTYGDIGDARDYTSPTASADVQMIPIQTQPKRIEALSSTPIAGAGTQGVSIGEEIEYRLSTLLPVALLRNFVIRDELPAGITCAEAPVVDLRPTGPYAAAGFNPGGLITPTCTDTEVQWNFGDQRVTAGTAGLGNRYNFVIGFIARVANSLDNDDGDTITNGDPTTNAFAQYVDEVGATITQNFNEVDVQIQEPLIALNKSFVVANADGGDVLTVTVTAANNGTATAYNLQVLDDLAGTDLTYIGNVGGANPPDTVDTATLGANRPIFNWNAPNGIDPTNSVSFTFEVRVDDGAQPQEILDNTIQAAWTSLQSQTTALNSGGSIGANGADNGMRNGALPNAGDAINDYEATHADDVLVPAVAMTKTDLNTTAVPAVGEHKSFQIEITLPEGVTDNLTVTDTLDGTGLSYVLENDGTYDITYTFQGIATINGAAPGEAAMTAFPADETIGSAVWNIGTVATQTEDDTTVNAINPLIRITYLARINNDAVTDAGDTLQNAVAVTYTHGETAATVTLNDATAVQTVVEPSLDLAKSVANFTNPGNPPQAGDTLRYTLTLTADGGAAGDLFSDAHDVRIEDTLSLGLVYDGNPTVDGAGNTIAAPATTGDGITDPQTLTWSLEDGNADIDIAEGSVVTVTYDVRVDNSVLIGQTLGNSVMARWTSLDGISTLERNGTAAPAYNDYYTGPVTANVVVGDNTTTTKTRLLDTYGTGDNVVRIGDIVEYELRLALQEGTYNNVSVTDDLPQGLIFEEIASINGDTTAPYGAVAPFAHADITAGDIVVTGNAATGPTRVTMTLGDIVNQADGNAANDVFVIVYRARVLNLVHAQVNTIALENSAITRYDTISGPATTVADTETIDVRQPNLSVAKSAVADGGDTVLDANERVTYTIEITNNGMAPAYDTVLQDIIPLGMRNGTATITMVSVELLAGGPLASLAPAYDAATGIATWDFDSGTADQYTIPPGDTLQLVYQTQTDAGLAPGMTLTNQAQVQLYYSFDDDAVPTRGGAVGVREIYGPSNTDSVTFTTGAAAALDKANSVATA
ncbi:MAG: isopeptide-forming domain-containing fimbrial protein, partial [Candidatus Thorarchaeota archaeon]